MSVSLEQGAGLPADVDYRVDCTLRQKAQAAPISLRATVCSRIDLANGQVRLGLQFIRDAEAAGRGTGFAHLLARVRT
jgi:hypothetical protein